jgi:hypothetical protein
MKTTLDIPDELLARLRERAARDGQDIDQVAASLLASGLRDAEDGSGRGGGGTVPKTLPLIDAQPAAKLLPPVISTDPVTGLPVIRGGPDAPISRMTAEEIQAIIDQTQLEEDLERLGLPPRR